MFIVAARSSLLAAACLAALGCSGGDGSTALSGSVTYNGAPVESGSIVFTPEGAGTTFGAQVVDGKYTAEKASIGKFTALVRADRANAGPMTREQAAQQTNAPPPNYIPETAEGNTRTIEITEVGQTIDFTITGPPRI